MASTAHFYSVADGRGGEEVQLFIRSLRAMDVKIDAATHCNTVLNMEDACLPSVHQLYKPGCYKT
jgi:hypothetical protein